jgi:hypothetical protein
VGAGARAARALALDFFYLLLTLNLLDERQAPPALFWLTLGLDARPLLQATCHCMLLHAKRRRAQLRRTVAGGTCWSLCN